METHAQIKTHSWNKCLNKDIQVLTQWTQKEIHDINGFLVFCNEYQTKRKFARILGMTWKAQICIRVLTIYELFQPKTSTFSTRTLIWVHYKVVHIFSQPIFSSFSHLNSARHNLVIELCLILKLFQIYITDL